MLLTLDQVRGCDILAKDGSIGKSHDFFFDDHSWTVRYLVVDTGWLFGRRVLVSPEAITAVDVSEKEIAVDLTKEKINKSPDISTDLPVSRQHESDLRAHYGWPGYWETFPAGMVATPLIVSIGADEPKKQAAEIPSETDVKDEGDSHLRSAREVKGYGIEAKDGEIGHVEDFFVEDDSWTVRYMVVDTGKWLPGRKVLIAPRWAEGIDWAEGRVLVDLDREGVKESPLYDPNSEIHRDYELAIHEYFGRKPYWA